MSEPLRIQFSMEQLRRGWESAMDGLRLTDSEGGVLMVNEAYCRLMQKPREALEGNLLSAAYLPEREAEILEKHRLRFRERAVAAHQETGVILWNGEHRILEVSNSFIELPGQPVLLLGVFRDVTARKQAETALREQEARLRMALEVAGMVNWEWDIPTGSIRYFENISTIVRGEAVAPYCSLDTLMQEIYPDDRERLAQALERTAQQGCPFECEYRPRMLDGTYRWISGKGKIVVREAGKPVRVLGISQDITALKRAEHELRILSGVVEQSPLAVIITDPQGNIEHVNTRFSQLTGYSLEEVRGKNPRLLKSGETPAAEYARLWQTITAGRDWHGQFHNKKKNGELFWESASISPLLDEAGRITHFVAIKEDITAQKRVLDRNAALLKLGRELSAASTPAEAARLIMDTASALFDWDAAFLHLCSRERDEMLALITMDTLEGSKVAIPGARFTPEPTPLMREVLRSGGRIINNDAAGEPPGGTVPLVPFGDESRRSASRIYVPIRHGTNSVGVMSIQSYRAHAYTEADMAVLQALADHCGGALERIHAAEQLKRLQQEVLEIGHREQIRIGDDLHDGLGQHLGGVAFQVKVLQDLLAEEGSGHEARAAGIVRLLGEAIAETRRLAQGLAPFEIETRGLVAALERLAANIQEARQATCRFTAPEAPLALDPFSAVHLFRIAQEAIHNAVRHGRARQIQIDLTRAPGVLSLQIRDDGAGFAMDSAKPAGMGLNIMRHRASVLGARLEIHSAPGSGCQVLCSLPLPDVAPSVPQNTPE